MTTTGDVRPARGRPGHFLGEIMRTFVVASTLAMAMLAGALSHVELGDEIPAELYKAVAEVLVFVLRLTRPARKP